MVLYFRLRSFVGEDISSFSVETNNHQFFVHSGMNMYLPVGIVYLFVYPLQLTYVCEDFH